MLRKEAMVRSAFVTHVAKMMLSGSLDVRACMGVPPVVLHLSLENIREEPPELLVSILSTIYISKPSIICMLSYFNNSVVAEFC